MIVHDVASLSSSRAKAPLTGRRKGEETRVAMGAGDRRGLHMASDLRGTAHWENGSATARPVPCSPSLPKHTRCLIEEVSAFFTLPNCRSSFATAGSAGSAGRPQGVPEVLPLPDVLPLWIVRCLKDEVAFVRQPGHVPRPSAGRYLPVLDPSCSRRPAPRHLPGSRKKVPLGAGSARQELGHMPPLRAPRQAAVPSPRWRRWSNASSVTAPRPLPGTAKGLASFPHGGDYLSTYGTVAVHPGHLLPRHPERPQAR